MTPSPSKKLSEVAREQNVAKATRFSNTMIPAPPPAKAVVAGEKSAEFVEPDPVVAESAASEPVQTQPEEQPVAAAAGPAQKPARQKRGSTSLTVEELIVPQPPKDENYPKQVRISAKHHRLLREVSFKKDVTINHVLYNLLEQLYEANQRDNQ